MPSVDFLKNLSKKLKTGNSRSIHLNVLPGRYATRLDVSELKILKGNKQNNSDLACQFLDILTSQSSFNFKISYSRDISTDEDIIIKMNLISRRLNSMFYEDVDSFLEHGIKNFGFGYPILLKRDKKDPDKIIKAPIFIWNLDIDKSSKDQNTWFIKRNEDYPIYLNQVLLSHILSDEGLEIKKISDDLLNDAILQKDEIIDLCNDILKQLKSSGNYFPDSKELINIPGINEINNIVKNKTMICMSGLFGIFRTQKESIITDIEYIISNYNDFKFENLIVEKYQTSTVSAVDTDPSQEEILNTISTNKNKIIQGPPGTGKSQTLTSLITNALDNNAKCLIVCEKKTALQVIYNNLDKLRLSNLCAIIDDVSKDRRRIIDSARERIDNKYYTREFRENEYRNLLAKYNSLKKKLNNNHKKIRNNIFGDYNWKEVIGMKLSAQRKSDVPILDNVKFESFTFSPEEYKQILDIIKDATFFTQNIDLKNTLFQSFYDDFFQRKYSIEIKQELEDHLQSCIQAINDIYNSAKKLIEIEKEYNQISSRFKDIIFRDSFYNNIIESKPNEIKLLVRRFSEFINISEEKIQALENNINLLKKLNSTTDNNISLIATFGDKVKALFRKTNKNKLLILNTIHNNLRDIIQFFENNEFCNVQINNSANENTESVSILISLVKSVVDLMKDNQEFLHTIEAHKANINFEKDYITKKHNFITKTHSERNYCSFSFSRTNEKFVLREILENTEKYFTFTKSLKENLTTFREYYNWRNFLIGISPLCRNLLMKLLSTETKDLENTFKTWYLNRVLIKNYDNLGELLTDERSVSDLMELESQIKGVITNKIIYQWETTQTNSINKYNGNIKALYNYRQNNEFKKRNSLRFIISKDFNLFTDLFPVVLVNPVVCSSVIPMKEGIFDLVIFDEASQLRIEDTYSALVRGKHKIVSGDKHQMPPSNYFQTDISVDYEEENEEDFLVDSESLLSFAQDYYYTPTSLDFHYRSKHPGLIDFSNNAFYGSRLMPVPSKKEYNPFVCYKVNSLYSNHTNEGEARKIVDILKNEIALNTDGNYPSIGIATMNLTQRNLILDLISEECYKDDAFELKFERLLEQGLFVKNLENIQGDERDIIIISTTFGLNKEGKFIQNFGPLNRDKGYRLLNVIITRAKNMLFLCTSIPESYYSRYKEEIEQHGNVRKGIFYAYIAYVEAVSNNKADIKESILNLLNKKCTEFKVKREESFIESPFEQEVFEYLKDSINPDNISIQHKVGGFRIDFVIKNGKSSPIALECDGKTYHSSEEAYSWDMYRQKQLEAMGFRVYRIWSTNWWIDPQQEISKLLKYMSK